MAAWRIITIPPNPLGATEEERTQTTYRIITAPPIPADIDNYLGQGGTIIFLPIPEGLDPAWYKFYQGGEEKTPVDDVIQVDETDSINEGGDDVEIAIEIGEPTKNYFIRVVFTYRFARIDGLIGRQFIQVATSSGPATRATLDSNGDLIRSESVQGDYCKRGLDGRVYSIDGTTVYRKWLNYAADGISVSETGYMIDADKNGIIFIWPGDDTINRHSATGSLLWTKSLERTEGLIRSMQADINGNVRGLAVFTRNSQDDSSCLYKISQAGVVSIFNISPFYGGMGTPRANGIVCYIDPVLGNYYVVVLYVNKDHYGFYHLRKYSSAGSLVWDAPFYSQTDSIVRINVDRLGNSYIAVSSGNIVKINDSGQPVWSKPVFYDESYGDWGFWGNHLNSFASFFSDIDFNGNYYGMPQW